MARFIHTADWQIGMKFRGLKETSRERMQQDRFDVINRIGDLCRDQSLNVEFVLVCGDLFDSATLEEHLVEKTCRNIERMPVNVYVISGNHEWGSFRNIFDSDVFAKHKPANLIVMEGGITRVNETTEIYALPMRSKKVADPFEEYVDVPRLPGVKRILAMHGNVDVVVDFSERESSDSASTPIKMATLQRLLDSGSVDYVALGDKHSTTDVENPGPLRAESSGRVFYPGAPEPTSYVEENQRNVLLVEISGDKPLVKPKEIGKWRFAREGTPQNPINLHSRKDIDDLLQKWKAQDGPTVCVRIFCNKYYEHDDELYFKNKLDDLNKNDFAAFEESEGNLDYVPVRHINYSEPNPLELSGFLLDAFNELRDRDKNGDVESGKALELLARLVAQK